MPKRGRRRMALPGRRQLRCDFRLLRVIAAPASAKFASAAKSNSTANNVKVVAANIASGSLSFLSRNFQLIAARRAGSRKIHHGRARTLNLRSQMRPFAAALMNDLADCLGTSTTPASALTNAVSSSGFAAGT